MATHNTCGGTAVASDEISYPSDETGYPSDETGYPSDETAVAVEKW